MTAPTKLVAGASSARTSWDTTNWKTVKAHVQRLQMRIAKAIREKRHGKAKALQWLLTHSHHAKLLAVKRVVQNRGGKTAGIDNITWKTGRQKIQAAQSLQRRGYQAQPLKRVYIDKKSGGKRPLHIPVMKCRAMQALHLLALEPIAEMCVDKNAYGFRPKRSTADAIGQCFIRLSKKRSASWILEGDIKACFDEINHAWLLQNIPTDKRMLSQWLTAGYIEQEVIYPTTKGVAQGGIISPTLMNMTMAGLEKTAISAASKTDKVHLVNYADDFIITGASKEILENKVKPAISAFLYERGLELSTEKTKITHIDDGFDFLGFNVRKYQGKMLIKPAKKATKSFLEKIRNVIKPQVATKTEDLIQQLNPMIRGWTNYYRHVVAKKTFAYVDHRIFLLLRSWIRRRHPCKNKAWRKKKYYRREGGRQWIFTAKTRNKEGTVSNLDLISAGYVPIRRHTKIRAEATPYDPKFKAYFANRGKHRLNHLAQEKPDQAPWS